jgi:hypothetical protein
LICQIEPRAWISGIDKHIDHVEIMGNRVKAINSEGITLWTSQKYEDYFNPVSYSSPNIAQHYYFTVDQDNDNKDELVFVPDLKGKICRIDIYSEDGEIIRKVIPYVLNIFPGDTIKYQPPHIIPHIDSLGNIYIFSQVYQDNPARAQFNTFDLAGNRIAGPYFLPGSFGFGNRLQIDIDKNGQKETILTGYNNAYRAAGFALVDPLNISGIGPPYKESVIKSNGLERGSQMYYVSIPKTPLSEGPEVLNDFKNILFDEKTGLLEIEVFEAYLLPINDRILTDELRPAFYYRFTREMIPFSISPGLSTIDHYNNLMILTGREPENEFYGLLDSLIKEVVVYKGDSIIYHPAAGINPLH